MSYSFHVKAASKAAAKAEAARKFDAVVVLFPHYEATRPSAEAAVTAFVDLLRDPGAGEAVILNVNGYLAPTADSANVGVSASVAPD